MNRLNKAGVNAKVDVYQGEHHAFDMMIPDTDNEKLAKKRFCEAFMEHKEYKTINSLTTMQEATTIQVSNMILSVSKLEWRVSL